MKYTEDIFNLLSKGNFISIDSLMTISAALVLFSKGVQAIGCLPDGKAKQI